MLLLLIQFSHIISPYNLNQFWCNQGFLLSLTAPNSFCYLDLSPPISTFHFYFPLTDRVMTFSVNCLLNLSSDEIVQSHYPNYQLSKSFGFSLFLRIVGSVFISLSSNSRTDCYLYYMEIHTFIIPTLELRVGMIKAS